MLGRGSPAEPELSARTSATGWTAGGAWGSGCGTACVLSRCLRLEDKTSMFKTQCQHHFVLFFSFFFEERNKKKSLYQTHKKDELAASSTFSVTSRSVSFKLWKRTKQLIVCFHNTGDMFEEGKSFRKIYSVRQAGDFRDVPIRYD